MVSCKNCTTQNSLDSAFCKKCGATMPADEIQAARERLEVTIADGFKIFAAGRLDEATQVAEHAVTTNPQSTSAWSLKAMCHERRGEIAEAIECHERVLAIDPDSTIDKIKVNDLRNLLISRTSAAAVPDRRMALVGAAAAFALVLSIGVILAKSGGRGAPEKIVTQNERPNLPSSPITNPVQEQRFGDSKAEEEKAPTTITQAPGAGTPQQTQQQEQPQAGSQQSPRRNDDVKVPNYTGDRLPAPTEGGGGLSGGIGPVLISPDAVNKLPPSKPSTPPTNTSKPVPTGGVDPEPTADSAPTAAQREAPGIMEIKIVSRNGQPVNGAKDPNEPASQNGVEALLRTARHQYQLGNWQSAALSYERALRAGADPASTNQRLAQCYEKLGRNSEAVAAYNRAISGFEGALNSGRGDKDRLSAALDSCRQAVKVLGG